METRVLPFSNEAIAEAAQLILAGEPVAVATETVYGLAGDATNAEAVARIYEAKGRPGFNPLIVHVSDLPAAGRHRHLRRTRARPCQRPLAGPFDAGRAVAPGQRNRLDRHRRPADHRPQGSRASGDAGAARGDRAAARRALGQRQRFDQPDPRPACAEEPRRARLPDPQLRRNRARAGIHHRRRDRRSIAAASAWPHRRRRCA